MIYLKSLRKIVGFCNFNLLSSHKTEIDIGKATTDQTLSDQDLKVSVPKIAETEQLSCVACAELRVFE